MKTIVVEGRKILLTQIVYHSYGFILRVNKTVLKVAKTPAAALRWAQNYTRPFVERRNSGAIEWRVEAKLIN